MSAGIIKFKELWRVFMDKRYLFVFITNNYLMLKALFMAKHYIKFIR